MYLVKYSKLGAPAYCIFNGKKLVACGLKEVLSLFSSYDLQYFLDLKAGRYEINFSLGDKC